MPSMILMEVWDTGSKIRGEFKHASNSDLDGCLRLEPPFHYGLQGSGAMNVGSGVGGGGVSISDASFSMYTNTASPRLMERCVKGMPLEKIKVHVFSGGANELVEVMTIQYRNAYITAYTLGGSGGEGLPMETLSISFEAFYVAEKEVENGQVVNNTGYGWDVMRNTEWGGE